jgi:hypothetical protein
MAEKSMMKQAYTVYRQSGDKGLMEWAMSLPADDLVNFLQEWLKLRVQLHGLMKEYLTPILEDDEKEDKWTPS